jgi:rare lipoprotein A (peptidoglycan hydrolase)
MINKLAKLLLVLILTLSFAQTSLAEETSSFSDVKAGNSHYVAIQYLKDEGILDGYENGSYKPNQEISRAEALKIIAVATGKITEEELENTVLPEKPFFPDVRSDNWYSKYLFVAKDKNIINGYPDGTFQPNSPVNLVETLKMYLECFDGISYPDPKAYPFADTGTESWYAKYVAYAAEQETLNISAKNEIFPDQKMTRGNFAEIIYRLKLSAENNYKFGKATFYGKAVQGHGTASGEKFDMNALTAAHKTLPFGTIVEVVNLSNGKKVEVKINDRGPFGPGRSIDLSSAAFGKLASLGTGIIVVQYHPADSI